MPWKLVWRHRLTISESFHALWSQMDSFTGTCRGAQCPHSLDDWPGWEYGSRNPPSLLFSSGKLKQKVEPLSLIAILFCTFCYRFLQGSVYGINVSPHLTASACPFPLWSPTCHKCDCLWAQYTDTGTAEPQTPSSTLTSCSSWWGLLAVGMGGRGKDNTGQMVVITYEVTNKVSHWPQLPIFSMPQSAPFVHSSFVLISPEMSKKVSLRAVLSVTLIRTTFSQGAWDLNTRPRQRSY